MNVMEGVAENFQQGNIGNMLIGFIYGGCTTDVKSIIHQLQENAINKTMYMAFVDLKK